MLAYCVQWHMEKASGPLLFYDELRDFALPRESPVAPAPRLGAPKVISGIGIAGAVAFQQVPWEECWTSLRWIGRGTIDMIQLLKQPSRMVDEKAIQKLGMRIVQVDMIAGAIATASYWILTERWAARFDE